MATRKKLKGSKTLEEKELNWQEFVEANKDKPIGEMTVKDIVRFIGEDDLLDEISENVIANAIDPDDYFFWRGKSDILDNITTDDAIGCLDCRDFDKVMQWCDENGDVEQWLDGHFTPSNASSSQVAAGYIKEALREVSPYRYEFLTKNEAIEEITQIINDNWNF